MSLGGNGGICGSTSVNSSVKFSMKDLNSASARRNTGSKSAGSVSVDYCNTRGNIPCSLNLCITEVSHIATDKCGSVITIHGHCTLVL
jgi:hypothetical protein